MAKIIENLSGRRMIKISTDDVISLVREYQNLTRSVREYEKIRKALSAAEFFLPEEI